MKLFLIFFMVGSMTFINRISLAQVQIYAHRGASAFAPENTLASALLGWEQDADGVEIDIYLTIDHQIVVIHDENTLRTTGRDLSVTGTCSDTLRSLDAGSWKSSEFKGEKIPFLSEILQAVPIGKKVIIEMKSNREIVPYLQKTIRESGKLSQCELISFDFEALTEAKKAMPEVPAYYLSSSLNKDNFSSWLIRLQEAKIDGLDLDYHSIDPGLSDLCRQNNIPLLAWTVDHQDIARKLMTMGVKAITTNKPLEIRRAFSE